MNTIPNSLLIENDIPHQRAAWRNILPFAHTFNGYEHWGSVKKCREVAAQGIVLHRSKQALAQSLTDLRTCLFFEARRWKRMNKEPSKSGLLYIHALVEAIRLHVKAEELA
jgi:hypothetical protein